MPGRRRRLSIVHNLPIAAWAALVGLISGGAPAADALVPCEPPTCTVVSHTFLLSPPVTVIDSGEAVEWRAGAGHHWFIESGTGGGCLGFKLGPDAPAYRVFFLVDDEELFAVHALPNGDMHVSACENAWLLPNGMLALRYACGLHQREGGVGLLLVDPAPAA